MMRIHDVPFVLFCETFYFITPVDIATIATFTGLLVLEWNQKRRKDAEKKQSEKGREKDTKKGPKLT
jgi:hypothetical protein